MRIAEVQMCRLKSCARYALFPFDLRRKDFACCSTDILLQASIALRGLQMLISTAITPAK